MKCIFILVFLSLILLSGYSQNYQRDSAFGNEGLKEFTCNGSCSFDDISLQSNGKIVACGANEAPDGNSSMIEVVRLLEDGSLDQSFGDEGVFIFEKNGSDEKVFDMEILPDDRILIAIQNRESNFLFSLIMLTADGQLDTNFGQGGIFANTLQYSRSFCQSLALTKSGKILAGGEADNALTSPAILTSLNLDGSSNVSFNGGNVLEFNQDGYFGGHITHIKLLNDESILVGGNYYSPGFTNVHSFVSKISSNGTSVSSFGNNGTILFTDSPSLELADVLILPDLRFLVVYNSIAGVERFVHYKMYDVNGQSINTFGSEGAIKIVGFTSGILLLDDKTIVSVTHQQINGSFLIKLQFYDDKGRLIQSINNGTFTEIDLLKATALDQLIDKQGRILAGGINFKNDNIERIILRYSKQTSSTDFSNDVKVVVYPNPVTTELNIYSDRTYILEIRDLAQRIIKIEEVNIRENHIDMTHFTPGLYFLKFEDVETGGTFIEKIVVE